MPNKGKKAVGSEGASRVHREAAASSSAVSGKLSFRDWSRLKDELVDEVRSSERLTKEDLAIRINTKD